MPEKITNPDYYRLFELRRLTLFDISYLCAGYYPDEGTLADLLENIKREKRSIEQNENFPLIPISVPGEVLSWWGTFRQVWVDWDISMYRQAVVKVQQAHPSRPIEIYELSQFLIALDSKKLRLTHTLTYAEWQEVFADWSAKGKELPKNPFLNPELRAAPAEKDKGADADLEPIAPATEPEQKGVSVFPTLVGTKWGQIVIAFLNGDEVLIKAGSISVKAGFTKMGMIDSRKRDKNKQWLLLEEVANGNGLFPSRHNKRQRQILARKLKSYFNLSDEPFVKKNRKWETVFVIHPETE